MEHTHENARLEALCDGVFAIALTLLIIDVALPAAVKISTTSDLWKALLGIAPKIYAFVLSFIVIFISWVNHHNFFKLLEKSSTQFIYMNGLLMLTIVLIPFPTNLLGDFILTNHAAPAVVAYNTVFALGGLAWFLISQSAAASHLNRNAQAECKVLETKQKAVFSVLFYMLLAVLGIWLPRIAAVMTTLSWLFWLVYAVSLGCYQTNANQSLPGQ